MESKIDDKNVLKVVYPKDKNKNNKYGAIGICEITLNKSDIRNNDKCAFSQFLLSECESISALIYSYKNIGNKDKGNNWQYLCDECDFNKIHLFDSDYLKQWIELKGCEYIHCPLCKTGIIEEKEHIEEHDIDSMEQLKERRNESKKENDLFMTFHIEQLILDKACNESWNIHQNANKLSFNQDILREVLNHWITKKKINEFRDKIIESTLKCIEKDNVKILKIILKYCGYDQISSNNFERNGEIINFINHSAKYNAFDCISLLLKSPKKLDWTQQKRPIVLLNAVKFHHENIEIIKFIINKLEQLKITFVCDDVMEQVIKFDLVDIAKIIVSNRWHKINEKDKSLAKQINLNCYIYFKERESASSMIEQTDQEELEWVDDGDDSFDDDDDWQNAED